MTEMYIGNTVMLHTNPFIGTADIKSENFSSKQIGDFLDLNNKFQEDLKDICEILFRKQILTKFGCF